MTLIAFVGGALAFAVAEDLMQLPIPAAIASAGAAASLFFLVLHLVDRPEVVNHEETTKQAVPAALKASPQSPLFESREMIRLSRQHLMRIASASADPNAARISGPLTTIGVISSRLASRLTDTAEPRLIQANSLEATLANAEEVVFRYLALEAGTLVAEEARKIEIRREITDEFLPAIIEALGDFARRLDEPELLELQASIKSGTTHMRFEGL